MIFESKKEQEKYESVAERVEYLGGKEETKRGTYRSCRVEKTNEFLEAIGDEAEDVVIATVLLLYELGSGASDCQLFRFVNTNDVEIVYYVKREKKVATFCLGSVRWIEKKF